MVQAASLPVVGGRYRINEQIGTGGLGIVYRATDLMNSADVALKLLKTQAARKTIANLEDTQALRMMLAREFYLLSSLRHPHIISVLDYGFDPERQPFYTMELIEQGKTILQAGRTYSARAKVNLLVQLLQALVYLHRRGVLHRDLKPSNILVAQMEHGSEGGSVKLLDFGLAQLRSHTRTPEEFAAGTLFYMAPEILSEQAHTEASDLYSVGLIAYELFAGRYPFKLETIAKLIDNIKHMPPDMSVVDADDALKAVIERLLAKTPEARYSDAEHVISDLCHAVGAEPPPESIAIRESFLQSAELIGRDEEMALLIEALDNTLDGRGTVWLIGGDSGVGKTRLMEELRTIALVRGALVVRGKCVKEGGQPYQLWRRMMRRLALSLELDDTEAGVLAAFMPDLGALLDREITPAELTPQESQYRLFNVIEGLLRRQTAIAPVVLLAEDIQWMGEDSHALLRYLVQLADNIPLLIVGSYSTDQSANLPLFLPDANIMMVDGLDEAAIARLSEAMFGQVNLQPHLIEFLKRETEGNAFFLVETVRALAEAAGRLDLVGKMTVPAPFLTQGIKAILRQRLARIPENCHHLMQLAAIAGREVHLELLHALEQDADLDEWLQICGDAAVIRVRDGTWEFTHDKLRDFILEDIPEAERRELHRRVAEAMERLSPDMDEHAPSLAYHWTQAGQADRAIAFALRTGERALQLGIFEDAARSLRQALDLHLQTGREDTQRAWIQLQLVRALQALHMLGEAHPLLVSTLEIYRALQNPHGIATTMQMLAQTTYQLGDFDVACRLFEDARDAAEQVEDWQGVCDILRALARMAHYHERDYERAEMLYQKALRYSQEITDMPRVMRCLYALGLLAQEQRRYDRADKYFKRMLAQARRARNKLEIARATMGLGRSACESGRYARAYRRFEEALAAAREKDWVPMVGLATVSMGEAAYRLGNLSEGWRLLRKGLQTAMAGGESISMLFSLIHIGAVYLDAGRLAEAAKALAVVEAHPNMRFVRALLEPHQAALRERLPDAALQEARARVQHLSPDALAHEILG